MRTLALACLTAIVLGSGTPTWAAGAEAEIKRIIADCQAAKAGCEEALWTFIDVSADDRLTVAEISRFFRFALDDPESPPGESSAAKRLLAAVIGGPLAARVFIKNFDYDGDDQVARKEFYLDDGAGLKPLLMGLRQAFAEIAGQATALAATVAAGAKKAVSAPAPAPAPTPAPTTASDPAASSYAAFLHQAGQCWQPISSAGQAKTPVFTYRVNLKTNGFLAYDPRRRSSHSRKERQSPFYEITRKRGLAAIADCQPYELPVADYERWHELDLSFSPQGLERVTAPRIKTAKKGETPSSRVRRARLTRKVARAFETQFGRCWEAVARPKGYAEVKLIFHLQFGDDGRFTRQPELISMGKLGKGWKKVADAARRAFARCQPYDLPERQYRQWEMLQVYFTKSGVRAR